MTNYAKSVNFAVKDTLTSGDPNKIVSGAEIDNEFNNIASSSTTKIDKVPAAQTNNLAKFTATGAIADSGSPASALIPQGGIIMWSGLIASIPTGWNLCDGTNGTPDLRDRFIVGAGSSYDRNDTGGADSVQLTENEMPSHNHSMDSAGSHSHSGSTSTDGDHSHSYETRTDPQPNSTRREFVTADSVSSSSGDKSGGINNAGSHSHSLSINSAGNHTHGIGNTGGGEAHENRPPYFALAFIMKL